MELDELRARLIPFCRAKYGDETVTVDEITVMPGHAGFAYGFAATHAGGTDRWFLRLPPPDVRWEGTADMLRQVTALRAVDGSGVPHCRVQWYGGPDDLRVVRPAVLRGRAVARRRRGRHRPAEQLVARPVAAGAPADGPRRDDRAGRDPPDGLAGALRLPGCAGVARAGRHPLGPAHRAGGRTRAPGRRAGAAPPAAGAPARRRAHRPVPRRLPVLEPLLLAPRRAPRRPRLGAVRHRRHLERRRVDGHVQRSRRHDARRRHPRGHARRRGADRHVRRGVGRAAHGSRLVPRPVRLQVRRHHRLQPRPPPAGQAARPPLGEDRDVDHEPPDPRRQLLRGG